MSVILSYIQARPLLKARKRGQTVVETSLDLGRSHTSVTLSALGAVTPSVRKGYSPFRPSLKKQTAYAV